MHERLESPAYDRYANLYIDKFGPFVRHLRTGHALTIIDAKQTAEDLSGAATNELLVVRTLSRGYHHIDFGNGKRSEWWAIKDFALCPPNFENSVLSECPHRIQIFSVHYPTVRANDLESSLPADGDFGALHTRSRPSPLFSAFLDTLLADEPFARNPLAEEVAITQLFSHVHLWVSNAPRTRHTVKERLGKAAVSRAIERLCAADLPTPTLSDLSMLVGLSPSHFCRAFRAETGLPPHRYQIVQRMGSAKDLLKHSVLPISEVAQRVGYGDPAYFSRIFAKETGFSPSEWRREVLN